MCCLELRHERREQQASLEAREGTVYESGCSMRLDGLEGGDEEIPSAVVEPKFEPMSAAMVHLHITSFAGS